MSIHGKRAVFVLLVLAAFMMIRVVNGITVTGSGGLGSVSLGLSEALVEFLVLAAITFAFFYWRARRQRAAAKKASPR